MSIGPFRVGDQPAEPLELAVARPGDTDPLSGFTSASIELIRPDRTTASWAGTITSGLVRSTFPAAFSQPGQHKIRVVLTGPGGVTERTGWAYFWVRS